MEETDADADANATDYEPIVDLFDLPYLLHWYFCFVGIIFGLTDFVYYLILQLITSYPLHVQDTLPSLHPIWYFNILFLLYLIHYWLYYDHYTSILVNIQIYSSLIIFRHTPLDSIFLLRLTL